MRGNFVTVAVQKWAMVSFDHEAKANCSMKTAYSVCQWGIYQLFVHGEYGERLANNNNHTSHWNRIINIELKLIYTMCEM